ncbi:MAG: helix-turn-helix domain-containing protein [Chloroflexi bacterium]|nr:MAG: helix-turn-helix domain-containing protein [Chloroflexota bacterium]
MRVAFHLRFHRRFLAVGIVSCILQLSRLTLVKRLTVEAVAEKLARHPELVRRWLRSGRLRGERVGWSWTVTQTDLDRFVRQQPQRRRR